MSPAEETVSAVSVKQEKNQRRWLACANVAVPTCWEQSAPFDWGRWKLHWLGSPLGDPRSLVCVAVIGVHTCVSADMGGCIWSSSVTPPASQDDEVKEANKQTLSVALIWSLGQKWSGTQLTDRLQQDGTFLHGFNAAIRPFVLLGQARSSVLKKMRFQNATNAGRRMLWGNGKTQQERHIGTSRRSSLVRNKDRPSQEDYSHAVVVWDKNLHFQFRDLFMRRGRAITNMLNNHPSLALKHFLKRKYKTT